MKVSFSNITLACLLVFSASNVFAESVKPAIGISKIEDIAGIGKAAQFSTMLESAIASTNKFRVIERNHLGALEAEQARSNMGQVTSNTPGQNGGFEGVDYLIYGSLTSVSVSAVSKMGATFLHNLIRQPGERDANCQQSVVTLGVDIKITDVRSGELKYTKHLDEVKQGETVCGDRKSDIDVTKLLRSASDAIAGGLVTAIYPIKIAAVQSDGTLILNYGAGTVKIDDMFTVFQQGETIKDPQTGEVLGSDEKRLGLIKITSVTDKFSKGVLVASNKEAIPTGSVVRIPSEDDKKSFNVK